MRSEKGKALSRPLGSPNVQSPWSQIFINPTHLVRMPVEETVQIDTTTVIGPRARRPLHLDIPIIITRMSYGGALSKEAKLALARGASLAGTATNTGEAPLVPEERDAADRLIGQFNVGSAADFVSQVRELKSEYDVPVGLKLAASHYLEAELQVGLEAGIDFFVVDGAEGGTHGGAPTLQDDVGLPTLAAGGLVSPGHFLKALALGADAVYIGTIALIGLMHTQIKLPTETPPQLMLYTGRYHEDLDVEEGARDLARFLKSCTAEMESVAYSCGHSRLADFTRDDLCTVNRDLAEALDIDWAGRPPAEPRTDGRSRTTEQARIRTKTDGQVVATPTDNGSVKNNAY